MNIFQLSISTIVFASTLLLGTTAVVASRFVITTVASLTKPSAVPESVVMPAAAASERVVDLPDLRNEPPPAPEDFDPSGTYSLDSETVPAAFADIEFLEIATREYGYDEANATYTNIPIVPVGQIQAKRSFAFTRVAISDGEISFETDTRGGISYHFVGNYPLSLQTTYCETCEYPPDLTGQLKKLKNGKVIAEMDAKFYFYDAC